MWPRRHAFSIEPRPLRDNERRRTDEAMTTSPDHPVDTSTVDLEAQTTTRSMSKQDDDVRETLKVAGTVTLLLSIMFGPYVVLSLGSFNISEEQKR